METLLEQVLEAHGGLERWKQGRKITARLSLGGPFWAARGWPEVYANQTVTLDPHREQIAFAPFTAPDRVSTFESNPERVAVRTTAGRVVRERVDPRTSFPPYDNKVQWDALQVAYFTCAAMWTYVTTPFLFSQPGVEAHEAPRWREGDEIWRRLAVHFPPGIATHNADQVFYFDDHFMLRRTDYSPDVTGNPPIAHYTYDPKTFGGFVFPTRRRVHLHDPAGNANLKFAVITIDIDSIDIGTGQP